MKTKAFILVWVAGFTIFMAVGVMFWGCSDDPVGPDTAEINAYLAGLKSWEEFSPELASGDLPTGEPPSTDFDGMYFCRTTPCSITETPEEIVTFGTVPNILYLGSLIQGNTYLGGLGSMEELPIRQRAPLTIALKLFTGSDITRTVENPDAATVQTALSDMVSEAAATGVQAGSRIYYDKKEMCSLHQATLSLGLSFKYLGTSATTQLDISTSREEHCLTAYFKQIMFEAYVVLPQTPAAFFSSDFTQEILDEQVTLGRIGNDNLPVFVSRIQYGRMMMFTMTSTRSVDSMRMALEASYEGVVDVGATIDGKLLDILSTSQYKVVTIGGAASTALGMLKSGNLGDYFAIDDPITTAEPISYALCNLADNVLAKVSETTEYDLKECTQQSIIHCDSLNSWIQNADQMSFDHIMHTFETNRDNMLKSVDIDSINPHNETRLYVTGHAGEDGYGLSQINFNGNETGYDFDYYLKYDGPDNCYSHWRLSYNDWFFRVYYGAELGYISIGDNEGILGAACDDDDFIIKISNNYSDSYVYAIGFFVGYNVPQEGEYMQIYYDGEMVCHIGEESIPGEPWDQWNHYGSFIGVVSTTPIDEIRFNEHSGNNNIFLRNFYFGVFYPEGKP